MRNKKHVHTIGMYNGIFLYKAKVIIIIWHLLGKIIQYGNGIAHYVDHGISHYYLTYSEGRQHHVFAWDFCQAINHKLPPLRHLQQYLPFEKERIAYKSDPVS